MTKMKAKKLLYLAIVAGILVSTVAAPVLAGEDPIPMWVHRARLAYNGRSSSGPDRMVTLIHVRDATNDMVAGATVTAEWTVPDPDEPVFRETMLTNLQGIARFSVWEGRGEYKICVIDVTKDGWQYESILDRETCAFFTVP